MASSNEDDAKLLREQNSELVLKVQYWKMKAAQQETEKLELLKENNNLRLKINRLRNGGAAQARALDIAHQAASEEALSHLVQASSALTRTVELTKTYMRQREALESASPRWSTLSSSPDNNKIHKVPPLLMGGKTIQPCVSLSRVLLNDNNINLNERNPNQNRNISERALPLPMHMLQDVYIPLRRLDAAELLYHGAIESDNDEPNAEENMLVEERAENESEESQEISEEDLDVSNQLLAAITEDEQESDDEGHQTPTINQPEETSTRIDNPLEGPSWLLDRPPRNKRRSSSCVTLEADSTTEMDDAQLASWPLPLAGSPSQAASDGAAESRAFTPTVRRRKRTSSPPPALPSPAVASVSPRLPTHPYRNCAKSRIGTSRVLKVVVPKIRLEAGGDALPAWRDHPAARSDTQAARTDTQAARGDAPAARGDAPAARVGTPPAKRLASYDAPSPNGATDAAVIVMDQSEDSITPPLDESQASNTSAHVSRPIGSYAHASRSIEHDASARHSEIEPNSRTVGSGARTPALDASRTSSEGHGSQTIGSDANVSARPCPVSGDPNDPDMSARARQVSSDPKVSARARAAGSDADASSRSTARRSSRDNSEGGEPTGRTRRPKKQVTYKEKPLNRKLRR